ncbi:MATE family efflux transporter [Devosia sp. FJ2-5-3]|jgi:putative MATE family efflux protein|uniref:MATE family efflux transporter n=1 Tax=Devosia sp. FJ2-5-3 TaxID=2976680 RepID=UPI0023D85ADC|nr:MATE family efflux transporter [Devosia sp. FJ2-5-3]WEJ56854.1 MATE family efflux transporter [Devosia sp. FJ2-5-3]
MQPTTRPLWMRFSFFLLPLMASNILQALSGTFNSIFIGQMIGVEALASLATFFPILFFLISFIIGLSAGSTILIGQAWGARNLVRVKQVTGTTITTAFLLGLVVAIIGAVWIEDIMSLLGAPENIRGTAVEYGRIMFIGMPGFFVFLVVTSVLRGVGDTITPLFSLILSMLVGVVLTPALIQGWWGLPQLGVNSAAWAFIAGFVVVLLFLFFYMRARKLPLAPDRELLAALKPDFQLLKLILKLGVPAGLQMVVASVAGIVVVGLVNRFGSNATAAYGALNQVLNYVQFPAMSIGIATSIFGAQAIGARQIDQLSMITRTALLLNLVITGSLIILAYLFSQHLVALFITDPEVIDLTEHLLFIVLWAILPFGWGVVFSGMMRASGMVIAPMLIALAAILFIELPGALWLSQTSLGLSGIWMAYAASFTAMLLMQAGWYHFVWKKKKIVALV